MPAGFSRRILTLLQFTRFALVFTAISNSLAAMMIASRAKTPDGQDWMQNLDPASMFWMTLISAGLYGFGMSLNDIIDRRRDSQIASDRPLPSGRIHIVTAHLICGTLLTLACVGAAFLAMRSHNPKLTLILFAGVASLIIFYDLAGKYLVPLGLLSLGLVRFFHASVAMPGLPLPWHALLMLDHVVIISAVSYSWEQKRPALTKRHVWIVALGLLALNVAALGLLIARRGTSMADWSEELWVRPELVYPLIAAAVFVWIATLIRARIADTRNAGKTLMLVGLLWLIVYDAAFVAAYVDWRPAVALATLLPVAWGAVKLTRAWAKLVALSEPATYIRAK